MATTWPLPSDRPDTVGGHLAPAARRRAEVDDALAWLQEAVLGIDLGQLEGRPRTVALALGGCHVGVVELALQPAL